MPPLPQLLAVTWHSRAPGLRLPDGCCEVHLAAEKLQPTPRWARPVAMRAGWPAATRVETLRAERPAGYGVRHCRKQQLWQSTMLQYRKRQRQR